MVECYWPEMTEELVRQTLTRVTDCFSRDQSLDRVQLLGCILVPSDGLVLFLFRGPSAAVVRDCSEAAAVPFDRIVESSYIGVSE